MFPLIQQLLKKKQTIQMCISVSAATYISLLFRSSHHKQLNPTYYLDLRKKTRV